MDSKKLTDLRDEYFLIQAQLEDLKEERKALSDKISDIFKAVTKVIGKDKKSTDIMEALKNA